MYLTWAFSTQPPNCPTAQPPDCPTTTLVQVALAMLADFTMILCGLLGDIVPWRPLSGATVYCLAVPPAWLYCLHVCFVPPP